MSSTDLSMNNVDKKDIDKKIEEKLDNNSKLVNKPELKRRNAIVNFELTESYKEFIKIYNYKEKEK